MASITIKEIFKKYIELIDLNNLKYKHFINLSLYQEPDDILYFGFLKPLKKKTDLNFILSVFKEENKEKILKSINFLLEKKFLVKEEIEDSENFNILLNY